MLLLRYLYAKDPASRDQGPLLEQIRDGAAENDPERILAALAEYSRRAKPAILRQLPGASA